jgi:gluconate 2-dehydrogenase alpha chain
VARQPPVDVVTVGAGWTAAMLAWKLTGAGYTVRSLEQGPMRYTYPDFAHNHDSLRYQNRRALMHNLARESWTWRPEPGAPSLPMRRYGAFHPGQGLGGAGVHWSGYYRFLPHDFRYLSHHVERYGAGKLPAGSTIQDWPLSYAELEPYYSEFEHDLGVSGVAGNVRGQLVPGGNPFDGPHSRPYPLPPLDVNRPALLFGEAARDLGYTPFVQPSGIQSRAYTDRFGNTRAGCVYCGFCTRYGCHVDAKSNGHNVHAPVALRTGRWDIRPFAKVSAIMTDRRGLATGVRYVDLLTGEAHEQPAAVVLLTGYTMTNVRLLLLSRSEAHPEGVGNDRGQVGRNFTYQVFKPPVTGVFEGERFNLFMGNTSTQVVIYDFYGDNFDHEDLDFIGGGGLYATPGEREPIGTAADVPMREGEGRNWGRAWKEALRTRWDSYVPINFHGESVAYDAHRMDLDPNYRDSFGQPLLRLTFDFRENERNMYRFITARSREIMARMNPTWSDAEDELGDFNIHDYQTTHISGGCIMGKDPGDSPVNRYGQVWDTPNVFVTGAALFPQNPGANPSATVGALAYLAGEALSERYFDRPEELLS